MIRKIRKKFTGISLVALALSMVLVAFIINIANYVNVHNEVQTTLGYILDENVQAFTDHGSEGGNYTDGPGASDGAEMSVNPGNSGGAEMSGNPGDSGTAEMSGDQGDSGTVETVANPEDPNTTETSEDLPVSQESQGQEAAYTSAGTESAGGGWNGHDPAERTRHIMNVLNETQFFAATISDDDSITINRVAEKNDYTAEELEAIVEKILQSDADSGMIEEYSYRVHHNADGSKIAVFLNCETKITEISTLAWISLAACVGGVLLAWLIVAILSKHMIRPFEENSRKQKQFITDAGHELKTPLTVISANMDILTMESGSNEWIESTQKQLSNMRKLVNELIYLSRMDEPDYELEKVSFDLSKVVHDVADPFVGMAEFSGSELDVQVTDGIIMNGDEASVRRLVSILCDNALKHSPEDDHIILSLSRKGKEIVLETENTLKEEISDETLEHLFDRFYRADSSRSKDEGGGFGIGLAVARAVAEKHGGSISACRKEPDRICISVRI